MNIQEEVDAALAIIVKSAKSPSDKLLVEYPLWEKLSYEARTKALERWKEYSKTLLEGYSWEDIVEMENVCQGDRV